ncbi:hypothetical protein LCA32G_2540 [Lacticaseibacillus paracasei]|nr:hypothetical protein LCA32G_2540 [Lacticaseibacillus paracasei]
MIGIAATASDTKSSVQLFMIVFLSEALIFTSQTVIVCA